VLDQSGSLWFLLETGLESSLFEPLIDFLAFVLKKLRLKINKIINSLGNKFWSCFSNFDFLVFLDVFWCAESKNDVSFFVVSAVFL